MDVEVLSPKCMLFNITQASKLEFLEIKQIVFQTMNVHHKNNNL